MKIVIICALALVALINGLDETNFQGNGETESLHVNPYKHLLRTRSTEFEAIQVCKPGDTKMDDDGCNHCFCIPNGGGWACTRMMCVLFAYPLPNDTVNHAEENTQNPHRVTRELGASFTCTPDTTFMDDCNHCFCLPDGHTVGCTAMACPPKEFSQKTS